MTSQAYPVKPRALLIRRRWEIGAAVALMLALASIAGLIVRREMLNQMLYRKLATGSPLEVRQLVKQGANVNARLKFGPPLCIALTIGRSDVAETLLQCGADVNERKPDGETPLHAAMYQCPELVPKLLQKGANVDVHSKDGTTPLFLAIVFDHRDLVQLLISRGASVDAAGPDHVTPLMLAAGNVEITQLLLAHGANVHLTADDGTTALTAARKAGNTEVLALLKKAGATR